MYTASRNIAILELLEQTTEIPYKELSDTANPNVTLKMAFVNFPQQNEFVFFLQLCVQLNSNKMFVSF